MLTQMGVHSTMMVYELTIAVFIIISSMPPCVCSMTTDVELCMGFYPNLRQRLITLTRIPLLLSFREVVFWGANSLREEQPQTGTQSNPYRSLRETRYHL